MFCIVSSNQVFRICYRTSRYWRRPIKWLHFQSALNKELSNRPKIGWSTKTNFCGELRLQDVGKNVTLRGFLLFQRMGKFGVLRDFNGTVQVIGNENDNKTMKTLLSAPYESYVEVHGKVCARPESMINKNMPTGEVEIQAEEINVLNKVETVLPFIIRDQNQPRESLGLQYRYLHLRMETLQQNIRLRSKVAKKIRDYLQDCESFVEIVTPTLSVETPGGAQEFLVPTKFPNKSYSLVQSPQLYKQLSMVGGFDRYFQFAVCYRDEGTKIDRQPEFMQIDIEMTDITIDDIKTLVENLLAYSWPKHLGSLAIPFPVLTYSESLKLYGTDKPDTRFDWKDFILNRHSESWAKKAQLEFRLRGPSVIKVDDDLSLKGVLGKYLNNKSKSKLFDTLEVQKGDAIVLAIGPSTPVLALLGDLRLLAAELLEASGITVKDTSVYKFLWIEEFPLFKKDKIDDKIVSVHHPFTRPYGEDIDLVYSDPLKARSQHYDLVLNGSEVGGGSIRIHEPELQRYILQNVLNINTRNLQFLIDALSSGAPPHGGIALGFDRLMAHMCCTTNIRDVMAFPKSLDGKCLMTGCPSEIKVQVEKRSVDEIC